MGTASAPQLLSADIARDKLHFEREPMSDQILSPEQQSAAFEEATGYLDSLPPGELERRIAEQDSAAERWPR